MEKNIFINAKEVGQPVYFMYEGQKRGGKVDVVKDGHVVIKDELRDAFRSFKFDKMTPIIVN